MRALAPHWGALLALALFLIAGLAVLDDYGVTLDEGLQRNIAAANARYATGDRDALYGLGKDERFYGVAFETPLLLVERAFGIQDHRGAHLSRYLLTHLFFLAGGLFAYLLARRLSGNSAVGLFAMALFLLHPRLYAHSFFNSKDIPFLVLFTVALFLARRAFRRDKIPTFVLLGAAVGVLVNLRIMGIVLLAAIPALRAIDFAFAQGGAERKRVILTAGAFALTATLSVYALLPYLWSNPVERAAEWWTTLSDHPNVAEGLFKGVVYASTEFPAYYVPVWLSVTSPPFALLLGLAGAAFILFRVAKTPREALRNTRLRLGLLLAACFTTPILAVAFLGSNTFNGWRHMYFLWAPFSLLAAWGLHGFVGTLSARRLRAAAYGAVGAGLAATLASMALIHPNQHVFFNFFVDRVTPEQLRTQYVMDYWGHPTRQALEWILEQGASSPVATNLSGDDSIAVILPDASRKKFTWAPSLDALTIKHGHGSRPDLVAHRVQVYGNTVMTVERKDDLRAVYDAARGREPDDVDAYDVHRLDDAVALVMEPCAPAFIERVGATLRVTPVDPADLPPWREGKREDPRDFPLREFGAFFNGKCVASLPLPDYPIADIEFIWKPELLTREAARAAMRRAKEEGLLLARSAYDVHLADGELVYVQEQCDPLDTEHSFRASVFSGRTDDSSERRREWGREIREFEFHEHGALLEEGACVALFPLPDYPIAAIRTAQYVDGEGDLWEAAFSSNPEPYAAAYRAVAGSEPVAQGAFNVHILDGDLVYVKEPCEQANTEARFFLHVIPERVSDLPEARRELGFDNLDFRFFLNGAWFDGKCAARLPLPDYPIASVRTGQFVGGVGEIWSAEFPPSPDGGEGSR